ncbi:MAG: hypothetical protein KDA84_23395, partial [Planctomycetaceae bacterium]|nr:hypothetical protein [Planctomycetaceae bacterium]
GLLKLDNGDLRIDFETSRRPIERLAFTPDNRRLVSEEFDRRVHDGRLKIWQLSTTQPAMVLQNPLGTLFQNSEPRGSAFGPLVQIEFCNSGKYLVCTSPRGVIVRDANKFVAYRFHVLDAREYILSLRPDAKQFAVNDGHQARFWDVASSKIQWSCRCNGIYSPIDFSPDNQLVAVCNETMVDIREARSGKIVRSVGDSNEPFSAVRFDSVGTQLATGNQAGQITVWNVDNEDDRFTLPEGIGKGSVAKIVFSGDRERLAASYSSRWDGGDFYPANFILVWDLRMKKLIAQLEAKDAPFGDFDLDSTGRTLAVAESERVLLWDVVNQKTMRSFSVSLKRILSIDISPDDQKLLTAGSDGFVRLWAMAEPNQELFSFDGHLGNVKAEFDGSGKWILSRGNDGTCCLFQPSGRKEVYPLIRPSNWLLAP